MTKQTLEQYLNNHPEIYECYVISQTFYDPIDGSPHHRENLISVKDWKDYQSYSVFSQAVIQKIIQPEEESCFPHSKPIIFHVKVPKKILKQEIINYFF